MFCRSVAFAICASILMQGNNVAQKRPELIPNPAVLNLLKQAESAKGNLVERGGLATEALEAARKLQDQIGEEMALIHLADIRRLQARPKEASLLLEAALKIAHALGDKTGVGKYFNGTAMLAIDQGNTDMGIELLKKAQVAFQEAGNLNLVTDSLLSEAITRAGLGQTQEALLLYDRCLTALNVTPDAKTSMVVLINKANLLSNLGQKAEALKLYQQALHGANALGDIYVQANILVNEAVVYSSLGQKIKALTLYGEAAGKFQKLGAQRTFAFVLTNEAAVNIDLGRNKAALKLLEQALPIFKKVGDKWMMATSFNAQGVAMMGLGKTKGIPELFQKALALFDEIGNESMMCTVLNNEAKFLETHSQRQRALHLYIKALGIAREISNPAQEWTLLWNMGQNLQLSKDGPGSVAMFKRASNILQKLRADIQGLDATSQRIYKQSISGVYSDLLQALLASGRLPEAQQVFAILKGEEFEQFLTRGHSTRQLQPVSLTLAEEALWKNYDRLAESLAQDSRLENELRHRTRSQEEEARLGRLRAGLKLKGDELTRSLGSGLRDLRRSQSNNRVLTTSELQRVQRVLQQEKTPTVAAYANISGRKLTWLVVSNHRIRSTQPVELPSNFKVLVFNFASQVRDRGSNPKATGKKLYDLILGPVLPIIPRGNNILFSLDGALRYLPLPALFDGKQYLVQRNGIALFSPLTFSESPRRLKHWSGVGLCVMQAHSSFPKLDNVAKEMSAVFCPEALQGEVLADSRFTKQSMMDALKAKPSVVHIASHFVFNPASGMNSYLLMGDGSRFTLDELNRAPEDFFSSVEMLTLSACETATSSFDQNGVENESFAVLAMRKGAGSVLSTLWPVSDPSTAILMGDFYRLLRSDQRMSKLDTLRRAQIRMLSGQLRNSGSTTSNGQGSPKSLPDYSHPYFWAPFLIMGDWR